MYDGESEDYYFWKCRGLYGGSTIRCKSQKQTTPTPPVINGVCDQDNLNICKSGTFQEIEDTDTEYLWNCLGQNGGKKSECKIKKNVWSCTSDVAYSCQRQTLTGTLEKKAGVAVLPFEGGKQWTCAQDVVCTMCNANYQANTSTNPAKCVKQQHQVEQVRACFYPAKGIVGISGRNFTYTCVQSSNQKCIKYDKGTVLNLKNYWNSDFGQKSNKFVGWAKENPYGQNQGGSLSAGNNNFVLNTYTLNTNTKFCGVYDNYECVGTLPSYAEWASGEEQVDLIEDTNISPVENNTNNPNKKCEYKCKPGYQLNGNLCSKIPEQPKRCGYIPTNAEFYPGDDQNLSANTESVYAASNTSRKCEWRCKDRYELLENNGQQFCPAKFECLVNEKAIGSSYYQSLCSGYKNKFACEREYWDGSGRGRCDPSREESQRPHTCRTSYPRHQRDLENSDIPPLCTLIPNSGFENIWCEVPTLCKWARWDGLDVPTNHYLP